MTTAADLDDAKVKKLEAELDPEMRFLFGRAVQPQHLANSEILGENALQQQAQTVDLDARALTRVPGAYNFLETHESFRGTKIGFMTPT